MKIVQFNWVFWDLHMIRMTVIRFGSAEEIRVLKHRVRRTRGWMFCSAWTPSNTTAVSALYSTNSCSLAFVYLSAGSKFISFPYLTIKTRFYCAWMVATISTAGILILSAFTTLKLLLSVSFSSTPLKYRNTYSNTTQFLSKLIHRIRRVVTVDSIKFGNCPRCAS